MFTSSSTGPAPCRIREKYRRRYLPHTVPQHDTTETSHRQLNDKKNSERPKNQALTQIVVERNVVLFQDGLGVVRQLGLAQTRIAGIVLTVDVLHLGVSLDHLCRVE